MSQTSFKRDHDLHLRRRGRNLGVLGALSGLVVMLFSITIVKMGDDQATVGNPSAAQAGGWDFGDFIAPDPEIHISNEPDRPAE
ncbi:MAG: hypothetical protein AAF577_06355 [Pseudomonadota bacterium]